MKTLVNLYSIFQYVNFTASTINWSPVTVGIVTVNKNY